MFRHVSPLRGLRTSSIEFTPFVVQGHSMFRIFPICGPTFTKEFTLFVVQEYFM